MILPCSIKHAVAHMSAEADTFVKAHANLVFQACRRGLPFLDVEWYIPFPPLAYVSGGRYFYQSSCQSRFSGFYRCFGTFGSPIRENLVYAGMLPCHAPSWPPNMQIRISFRSRSDLVLDADQSLDFSSYLVLQACLSFYSVLDKSGA